MTHFDLFSGYGGFSLALEKVYGEQDKNSIQHRERSRVSQCPLSNGNSSDCQTQSRENNDDIITIGFSEIDKYASSVLKYHWPNTKNYGDITKINWSEVPDFDLLTGGSPCQDLSIAGKRQGLGGARSGLYFEYMRAVREKRPKYFIWENVKGALSSNNGKDFGIVLNEMAEAGYSLWWQVLNAKDFGVPQNRERIFVVGFRDEPAREIFFERGYNQEVGSKVHPCIDAHYYKGHSNQRQMMEIKQLNNPTHSNDRVYGEDGLSPCLNTMQSGNRQPFVCRPVLTPDRLEKRQNGRRFKEDGEPSFTLTSQDKHGVYLPPRIRRLTPTECERLMGLPDGWTAKGIIDEKEVEISDSQRYKLCGNGVVVNVVEEIIKNLITI
jgi:DNA (cytosine-5)-methyltransferase 1